MKKLMMIAVGAALAFPTVAGEGVYINSDAWNFWLSEKLASMNRDELKAEIEKDVDFYATKGVKAVLYNMNIQRCFYPTKVATPFWKDVTFDADGRMLLRGKRTVSDNATMRMMYHAVTNMVTQVPDFMRYRYDYCHKKGVEMWHSFRVSDVHGTTLGDEWGLHSDLWLDHKECIHAWYRHTWRGEWPDGTLDYANKLVYDTQLATVRELLLDYPSDGIGFDWLRACPVLKPGFADRDCGVLTQFLRDVRRIANEAEKKWGHRIRMAHRVPARVRDAWGAGFDIPTWAKEGLVDVLIPGGTPATTTEQDCEVALYRALAPRPVVIAAEIDCSVFAQHGWYESIDNKVFGNELDAGFASSFYQQGADTIYFYNHFPRHGAQFPWVREMFTQASDRKVVAAMARRHPATYHIRVGESRLDEPAFPAEIWAKCCNGGVNICCGEGNEGRTAKVVIGATVPLDVDVLVNTVPCGRAKILADATGYPSGKAKTTYYTVAIPAGALHDGINNVELFNHGEKTIKGSELVWMEIAIGKCETVFVDTPQKAAAAVRSVRGRAGCPTDIVFAPGTYEFAEPLEIGPAGSHVRLRAEKPGTVRLTRSVAATPGGTVDCTEPPAPDAENFVSTRAHAPLFFYDHKWAVAARWPNEGWAYFTKAVDSGLRSRIRGGIAPDAPTVAGSFVFDSDRPSKWNFEDGVYLAGYFTHDWAYELIRADSFIVTPSNRVMKMRGAAQYGLASGTWSSEKGRRFYAYNIRAELDAPGEFFYDRKTKKVDFIPPPGGVKEFRAVTKDGPIVRLTGASDVTFEGLTFEYAVGNGLDFNSCTNCRIENCTIANVGGDGIALQGGRACTVRATRIDTTGLCAVSIAAGDRWTLTSCEHLVEDCEMIRFGTVRRTYAPGVRVSGVGTTLRGNRLHDAPHSAVLYHANDCLFERNEVWDIMRETGDAGAFYTGRDPTSRGNVLRFNYVHDLGRPGDTAKNTMAFYLDDCDAGDTVASNRVKNVARGLMLGGGHDNHIIGNVFEDCAIGMSIDARGVVWDDRWDSPIDKSWQMTRKVKEMQVEREPWRTKYPLLLTYLEDGPREPRHIDVVGNTFKNCKEPIVWSMRANEFKHLIRWSDNTTDGRALERD